VAGFLGMRRGLKVGQFKPYLALWKGVLKVCAWAAVRGRLIKTVVGRRWKTYNGSEEQGSRATDQ